MVGFRWVTAHNGRRSLWPRPHRGVIGRGLVFPLVVIAVAGLLLIGYFAWGWRVRPTGLGDVPAPDVDALAASNAASQDHSAAGAAKSAPAMANAGGAAPASSALRPGSANQKTASATQPPAASLGLAQLFAHGAATPPESVAALLNESKQVVKLLTDAYPKDADAHEVAARLFFRLGDNAEARAAWQRCLEINPGFVYALHGLGRAAAKRGDDEQAIELFRRALRIDPNAVDIQVDLAQALIDTNQMEDAIRLLETNVAQDPRRHRGYVLLGMAHMQLGNFAQAKANYQAALKAFPNHANACFGLATACARLGETQEAQKYTDRFRELRAAERAIGTQERSDFDDLDSMRIDTAASYTVAARVFQAHQNTVDTELLCRRAAALDPKNVECRQGLAWLYTQTGKIDETVAVFQEIMALEPGNMRYPLQIALLYASSGRPAQGERFLRGLLEDDPNDTAACAALASFLLQRNTSLQQAVTLARQAVRLEASPTHYALLSAALERTGDVAGAIEAITTAIRRAPDNVQLQRTLDSLKQKYEQ